MTSDLLAGHRPIKRLLGLGPLPQLLVHQGRRHVRIQHFLIELAGFDELIVAFFRLALHEQCPTEAIVSRAVVGIDLDQCLEVVDRGLPILSPLGHDRAAVSGADHEITLSLGIAVELVDQRERLFVECFGFDGVTCLDRLIAENQIRLGIAGVIHHGLLERRLAGGRVAGQEEHLRQRQIDRRQGVVLADWRLPEIDVHRAHPDC